MPPWLAITTSLLSIAGVGLTGWLAYRTQTRAKRIETTTPPYDKLAARVSALEGQVDALRAELHEARTYTHLLISERPPGMLLPQPVPAYLTGVYLAPTPSSIIQPQIRGPIDNP